MRIEIIVPLLCGLGYALGAIFLKKAMTHRVGQWRVNFVTNLMMALVVSPLWLLGGQIPQGFALAQPVLAGICFFCGQICTFAALGKGDVSVATPVLGAKVLLVALLTVWIGGESIPPHWWGAAALSSLALALMGAGPSHHRGVIAKTVALSLGAATCFAAADVLVQLWTPLWGPGRFIPIMFGSLAVCSLAFVPHFTAGLRAVPRRAWAWLIPGSVFIAIQGLGMALTIGVFGGAAAANVLYSSRGLWSVLLVAVAGRLLHMQEGGTGRAVLFSRFVGALLVCAAIVLIVR